jgi:type II secretory pathway pseudopilin PulG
MSIGRKNIIRHYTIIEVMVAMGIFLIMMTIMMQFFTSAQKVWNLASKRNMLYADARVAMNLMTRELQSMLYDNDADSNNIYPFWYQWTETNTTLTGTESIPQELEDYWVDNKDLPEKVIGTSPKDAYLTVLNFISTTDLKPVDEGSDVCEIRYRFVPVYFTSSTPTSFNDVKGGKLQRCCTAEYYDNSGTSTLTPSTLSTDDYNFGANPYPTSDRTSVIWKTNTTALDFQTVITGVYSLRFSCYKWTDASGLTFLDAMNDTSPGVTPGGGSPADGYNLTLGTPAPVAIRIDMKLMDPKDLKKLAYYIYVAGTATGSKKDDAEKQIKTLKQTMRNFSKIIYLGKREN